MDPLSLRNSPEAIAARTTAIHQAMLQASAHIRVGNFDHISNDDLARLFGLYDQTFFDGWLDNAVRAEAHGPPYFRLSRTMTRAGGKTIKTRHPTPGGTWATHYEIAVASRMLFMTFDDVQRPVVVCGLACRDRLEALQRIMEHEILHLLEMLQWGRSSCAAARFKALAGNIFGHTSSKHDLVTPREHAAEQHGVKIGSMVEFEFEGVRRVGRVNRIHHRATVLVESKDGELHSDGKTYHKYYVPLPWLKVISAVPGSSGPPAR